jgi:hypothetical protein
MNIVKFVENFSWQIALRKRGERDKRGNPDISAA